MSELDYTAIIGRQDRRAIAAALRKQVAGVLGEPPYDGPPVHIGFDAEWVTMNGRELANMILSYQLVLQCGDRRVSLVIYPSGPHRSDRLSLDEILGRVLLKALGEKVIPAFPDHLIVFGHFLRADLATARNFWPLKRAFSGIGRTLVSTRVGVSVTAFDDGVEVPPDASDTFRNERGFADEDDCDQLDGRLYRGERVVVRNASRRAHPILVRFLDTMLLTPGRAGLAVAGKLVGLDKLSLPPGYSIDRMDILLAQDRAAFERYALRDAEVALEYGLRMERLAKADLGLRRLPATLAGIGVSLFSRDLRTRGVSLRDAFGLIETRERRFVERIGRYRTLRRDQPCFGREIHDAFARAAYHGGRNECFTFGPTDVGVFYDYDLPGAYTTAMCWLRPLDYNAAKESSDLADFALGSMGIAKVRFQFPVGTRFPSLPVRTLHGLLFPLAGESICTAPEIAAALSFGAEIEIQHGIVMPWASEERLFKPFSRIVQDRRRVAVRGSFEDLVWKEVGNSLYGKTAQGVRDNVVFDPATGRSRPVGPSAITNPWFAAWTTGFIRAVLAEILVGVPSCGIVVSATTDGMLTDIPLSELRVDGPVCSMFADLREHLFGDRRVLEEKHRVAQVLPFKTRGQITALPIDGHPIVLAKAGLKPACPLADHNDYMLRLFLNRHPGQTHTLTHLISMREMWLREADMVSVSRERRLNMEFDFKRRPLDPCSRVVATGDHLAFSTTPWATADDAVAAMTLFEGWRIGSQRVLKTNADFLDWQDYYVARVAVRGLGVVVRSDGSLGVLRRQFLRAFVREEWGLSLDGWSYEDIAHWLTTRGYDTSTADVKNSKRANARLVPHCVSLVPEVIELLRVILAEFPGFDFESVMVESDVERVKAILCVADTAGG